jgi:hypothetical protein
MSQEQQGEPINGVQQLYFELIQRIHYNLLDGESVVRDLLDWRERWYSVTAARLPFPVKEANRLPIDLSLLRTARWNSWPADTLYIWTNDEEVTKLQRLIEERWQPSEVGVLVPDDIEMAYASIHDEHDRVLYVWWD